MAGTVLLRHDTPDGDSHFDWMIERGGSLITFRVRERIDRGCPRFEAHPLPDHRADYLRYEGAVSGGRGSVVRTAAGEVQVVADEPRRLVVRGTLGGASGVFEGRACDGGPWRFTFVAEKLAEGG